MSWEKVAIKSICKGIYDGPHATPPMSDTGAIFLGISNFNNGRLDLSDIRYISENDLPKWTKRVVPKANDIVFSYEATLNLYAIIPDNFRGCLGRRMALIRVDEEKAYYKFLYYYFYSDAWRTVIQENTVLGATVDRIPLIKFPDFPIYLPPIKTQRRIADILSAYDDLIENNRKQIKLLEEAAQRLYKEWFVDLRFPGYEHTKIMDGVPEGWKKSTVLSASSVLRRGISPRYNDLANYMVINQKCIRQTVVSFEEARNQEKPYSPEMNLQDSDTVICSTGAGTLGRVGQIFGNYPNTTFDSHVTLVRAMPNIGPQYLFWFLKSKQEFLMGMGKGSTNQLELSRGTIQDLTILVPTEKVVQKFEVLAQDIHDKISVANNEITRLKNARDYLLPKLMSEEVEV